MKYQRREMCALLLVGTLTMIGLAFAAGNGSVNKDPKGLAVKGYDVMGYFDEKRPVKGTDAFKVDYEGATYLFASAAHRDQFAADPAKYVPQYGGYCAYGMAKGHKAPVDPEAWSVIDGRLYLNYSTGVAKDFAKDRPRYIHDADANWPKLK
ncbi:MAG: YHS domain-containing (seleno)protein [Bryobacteraceae bacterium]